MRKPVTKIVSIVVGYDDGPTPPSAPTQLKPIPSKRGTFKGNIYTERRALRLVLGPLDYSEEQAAVETKHPLRSIREHVKRYARIGYEVSNRRAA